MSGSHDLSLFTDDLECTVAELKGRGLNFDDGITDRVYGLVTHFTIPGGVKVQLYQPKYQKTSKRRARASVRQALKTKVSARKRG